MFVFCIGPVSYVAPTKICTCLLWFTSYYNRLPLGVTAVAFQPARKIIRIGCDGNLRIRQIWLFVNRIEIPDCLSHVIWSCVQQLQELLLCVKRTELSYPLQQ